jgi:hypothetical protein
MVSQKRAQVYTIEIHSREFNPLLLLVVGTAYSRAKDDLIKVYSTRRTILVLCLIFFSFLPDSLI